VADRPTREKDAQDHQTALGRTVARKAERRLEARRNREHSVWFGMGMFGLVGWTVAIPTIGGLLLGAWIDKTWPSRFSWTLTGLLTGLALGCAMAWRWVKEESRE
jgi:ATP synthase protein I